MSEKPSNPADSVPSPSLSRRTVLQRLALLLTVAQLLVLALNVACRLTYGSAWPTAGIWLGAGALIGYAASYVLSTRASADRAPIYLLVGAAYCSAVGLDTVPYLSGGSIVGYATATLVACLLLSTPAAAGAASLSASTHLLLQLVPGGVSGLPLPGVLAPLTDSLALAAGLGVLVLFAEVPSGPLSLLSRPGRRSLRRLLGVTDAAAPRTKDAAGALSADPSLVPIPRLLPDDVYRHFFEASPSPLWEMDLSDVRRRLEDMAPTEFNALDTFLHENPTALRTLSRALRLGRMNEAARRLFEADDLSSARLALPELLGRVCPGALAGLIGALASGRTEFQTVCALPTLKGGTIDVLWSVRMVPGSEGTWDTLLASATDVSEQVRSVETLSQRVGQYAEIIEAQARLAEEAREEARRTQELLREVSHRTKNNLASIMGLLYAEARSAGAHEESEPEALAYDVARRVQGLVTVHDLLSDSHWQPLPLDSLLRAIVDGAVRMAPSTCPVTATVGPSSVHVSPREANTLALVVNELAMNTVKHALQEGRPTRISVRIAKEGEQAVITYRDDGPGYPDAVRTWTEYGHGLSLVRNMVKQELEGELVLDSDRGAVTTIRFRPMQPATAI